MKDSSSGSGKNRVIKWTLFLAIFCFMFVALTQLLPNNQTISISVSVGLAVFMFVVCAGGIWMEYLLQHNISVFATGKQRIQANNNLAISLLKFPRLSLTAFSTFLVFIIVLFLINLFDPLSLDIEVMCYSFFVLASVFFLSAILLWLFRKRQSLTVSLLSLTAGLYGGCMLVGFLTWSALLHIPTAEESDRVVSLMQHLQGEALKCTKLHTDINSPFRSKLCAGQRTLSAFNPDCDNSITSICAVSTGAMSYPHWQKLPSGWRYLPPLDAGARDGTFSFRARGRNGEEITCTEQSCTQGTFTTWWQSL